MAWVTSGPSRGEVVWSALALLSVMIGLIASILGSSVMVNGHAADCHGDAMSPDETCGAPVSPQGDPEAGRSYEEVKDETTTRRNVGYAGLGLSVFGVVSTFMILIRNRRRHAPRSIQLTPSRTRRTDRSI